MKPKKELSEEEKTEARANRAIRTIQIVMGLFILIPLVLAWWSGALSF